MTGVPNQLSMYVVSIFHFYTLASTYKSQKAKNSPNIVAFRDSHDDYIYCNNFFLSFSRPTVFFRFI